jgi:putative NADH-flavin reductase
MKIALFGGTGPTGRHIIEEALRQGYELSIYARDAGKLSAFGSKIEVIVGDLNNREAIKACVAGSDAVISALGPNSLKAREKRPIMRGVGTIISVMEELNVRRFIQCQSACKFDPSSASNFDPFARRQMT